MKARVWPSGCQFGWQLPPGMFINCSWILPSEFIIHICIVPVRLEANATCPEPPPSGVGPVVGIVVDVGGVVGVGVEDIGFV
ncbi:MAG: hypothetical protein MUO76_12515, partial [Anaerolineaceae bacterium]|nr:hypothetical protein [Anaerolineaceae bacterium]